MFKSPKFIISALLVVVIILASGCVFLACQWQSAPTGPEVINQAWDLIFSNYIDNTKLDSEAMTQAALQAIINTIDDPHSVYMSKAQYEQFITQLQGKYAGIGAVIALEDEKLVVTDIFADSPAEKAGVQVGDEILEIDGESVAGMSLNEISEKMSGAANTTINLQIMHENQTTPITLTITRDYLNLPSVYYTMMDNIAYIGISHFTERTEAEIAPYISQLKTDNAEGIVIDLRGNTGGYLDIVIKVANHFIDEGVIVKVQNSDGSMEIYETDPDAEKTDLPIVILVDGLSASGSEVFAGALQDHGRAVLAGTLTYGKGSVNKFFQLGDGSAIYLTIARWLTPNDRLIEGQGITPDFPLDLTGVDAVQWAITYLNSN
ncbi:MAG: S41 family peptidase [Dehalococcoidales bacterium]|nr:S41 family peptidase [Dehalococcoidales bacterium]